MAKVRVVTKNDKLLVAAVLFNAGVKARLRMFPNNIRAVFNGDFDRALIAKALNRYGFRMAGGLEFSNFSFNGNEVHIRGVAV